ncbi:sodium-dependent transporter [Seongchinamella unica]|uniref:Sodium-dependent transporter n=1 Tax=Seongchinamella unica TaxID=2547392 RepID=A0A4R5LUY4_9GAMM|nr:sodium-dependent transporter [Seongchinamella unica]TDG15182.1 sodium-dependent transporter [Seongchinamella unica]
MSQALVGSPVQWHSRTTFVLALSSAAVGLGSLWRFSWLLDQYGGGAFMLCYVIWLFVLAVPVLCAEVILGYWGRGSPVLAIRNVCDRSLLSRHWQWLGLLACITGVLIAGYQAVVAGWSLYYIELMRGDELSAASMPVVAAKYSALLADSWQQLKWQSFFLAVLIGVLALGVRRGLGVLVWLAVPVMITLLGILVQYALDSGELGAARNSLFTFKWVDFTAEAVLAAMGHALFTLAVGVGAGMVYGAYAPRRIPIGRSVIAVALFDTVVALLAGIAIFPVMFSHNLAPAEGPGLLFISVPYAFANAPQGELFGSLFFGLTTIVTLGFAVALTEPAVRVLQQQLRLRRVTAVAIVGGAVWLLAWMVAGSVAASSPGGSNLLQTLDFLTANVLLPLVCLFTALLMGWGVQKSVLRPQLGRESDASFSLWHAFLRYIAPPAIILVMESVFW